MILELRSIASAFLLATLCVTGLRAAPATQPVEDAVAHLGDSDPAVRDQAVRTLRAAGSAARAALQAAANGDDPEIAGRARNLLRDVPAAPAAQPAEPEEILPGIVQYKSMPAEARLTIIKDLANTPAGLRALTRLWLTETNPDWRDAIFDQLITALSTSTSYLLADGNVARAELLLGAAVDRKSPDSPRAYAAYWLTRGKLDDAIRRWASRGGQQPADTWAEEILAALYRAKGDSKNALTHARASDDGDLLRDTLVWAGDWRQLAEKLRRDAVAAREPRELALLCGADSIAGDRKALDTDVVRLLGLAHGEEQAAVAGDILLLLNRPDDAIRVLKDARQYSAVYEILDDRGKFDDAAALLSAHDAETNEEALQLRGTAAREFARLGLKKQCAEMIARLATENAVAKSPRTYVALAEAERSIGMMDKSWEHFLSAIQSAGENSPRDWYVARAFPPKGNDIEWSGIWNAAFYNKPDRPLDKLFERIRLAYDNSIPTDELATTLASVHLADDINHPYVEFIWEAARRMRAVGKDADAVKFVDEMAQATTGGELYLHLGDSAAEKGDWQQAAIRYEAAWKKDRTRALPLYLQGWAMERAGQPAEGRERMALAHQLPLADEVRRSELIHGLFDRGLDDAAAREADVLIRTGNPLSSGSQEALRSAASLADDRGDFSTAAALWQRVEADYLAGSYWFESHAQYLHLPNAARESRARALIAAGDWEGAGREIDTCMEVLPIDSSIVIDVVPELDKAGRHAEADALFDKMFAVQEALCDKFSDSTFQLNECAWLAAKCSRQLDKAIAHAKRAVELDPKTDPNQGVDAIDTLAEAYFRHGDYALAVEQEKKCVEKAPNVAFHRKQLARFETKAQRKE